MWRFPLIHLFNGHCEDSKKADLQNLQTHKIKKFLYVTDLNSDKIK